MKGSHIAACVGTKRCFIEIWFWTNCLAIEIRKRLDLGKISEISFGRKIGISYGDWNDSRPRGKRRANFLMDKIRFACKFTLFQKLQPLWTDDNKDKLGIGDGLPEFIRKPVNQMLGPGVLCFAT